MLKSFYIGNTKNYNMTFTESTDNAVTYLPVDVSGWQIFIFFKRFETDLDANSILQKVVTLPSDANTTLGKATLTLDSTDTDNFLVADNYFYGIKRILPGSNPADVLTLETGMVQVLEPGSRITTEHSYIPYVTGLTQTVGTTKLQDAGFVIGAINIVSSLTTASGNISSIQYKENTYLPKGTSVDIEVAL